MFSPTTLPLDSNTDLCYNRSMIDKSVEEDATGVTYRNAETSLQMIQESIASHQDLVFETYDECTAYANEVNLGVMAYSPSTKGFYHVDHRGELLADAAWLQMYGSILSYWKQEGNKKVLAKWVPPAFEARSKARIVGETGNGIREALYERNYFVPTGYRNPLNGLWNVAKPIPTFARLTGADTTHIYQCMQYIAGDNYEYLLAWLRQKILYPKKKTDVIPVFKGKQGTGKSTFGELICRAMFGEHNVLVTRMFNGAARFNSDQTEALVIAIEEKAQDDKFNTTSILKSLATAKTIRKELKGLEPYYQESYTEYMLTTNDLVPIKFDNLDQRRFMVMETNPEFVRKPKGERETDTSKLADEIFTKLYGEDRHSNTVGLPLTEQIDVIEQFKWELLNKKNLPSHKDFIRNDAFKSMYAVPRSNEAVEIETFIRTLAPFIAESLVRGKIVQQVEVAAEDGVKGTIIQLDSITEGIDGFHMIHAARGNPTRLALNQMLLFRDERTDKAYSHSVIAHALANIADELEKEFNLKIMSTTERPTNGGFKNCIGKYRLSPAIWFCLKEESAAIPKIAKKSIPQLSPLIPVQYYARYNDNRQMDERGAFEVLNPLIDGLVSDWGRERCSRNVRSMSNFLLECDETSSVILAKEQVLLSTCKGEIDAEVLYKERLDIQKAEATRLVNLGVVNRVVYSGNKSLHMRVTVKDAPDTIEERRWLDAYLKMTLSPMLLFDMQTSDAARLTRAPIEVQRVTEVGTVKVFGLQRMLKEKDQEFDVNWRPHYHQWLNQKKAWYEEGAKRKLLPAKTIYKQGAIALLDGTFWTDHKWNGQRNAVFFVAYRLCRLMGHSEEDCWAGIEDGLKDYYKPKEVQYWLSRRTCPLIASIEQDIQDPDDGNL